MLLAALDVGNTRLHAALFSPTPDGVALVEERAEPDLKRWRAPVAEVVYASVRPETDRAVERAVMTGWGVRARKMGRDFSAAIPVRTRQPRKTGADRIANGVA